VIQFYSNNVTNLHQLISHSTTSCPTTWRSYRDQRLLRHHHHPGRLSLVPSVGR